MRHLNVSVSFYLMLCTLTNQDQYCDTLLEKTSEFVDGLAEDLVRLRVLGNNLQRYSNVPLEECHKRGASMLIGLYEYGVPGMLMNQGIR